MSPEFDFRALTAQDVYKLTIGATVPRPIVLVTSVDAAGRVNAAPFSFSDCLSADPPILALTAYNDIETTAEIAAAKPNCGKVMSTPGIRPMITTAMVAAIGAGDGFAAWVGVVPRQYSTGGRTLLGRISKRGSRCLRMLFVQAAKVIRIRPHLWPDFSFGACLTRAAERMHRNKRAVALANKLARMAWSVLRRGARFDERKDAATAI